MTVAAFVTAFAVAFAAGSSSSGCCAEAVLQPFDVAVVVITRNPSYLNVLAVCSCYLLHFTCLAGCYWLAVWLPDMDKVALES